MPSTPAFVAHHRSFDGVWQLLPDHLVGVSRHSRTSAQKVGLGHFGELAGLLHDLGKYSSTFQAYLKSALGVLNPDEDEDWVDAVSLKGKVDHSSAGAQWAWRTLGGQGSQAAVAAQALALCVASHHSGLIDCVGAAANVFGEDVFSKRMCKADEKTHLDEVLQAADPVILDRCVALLREPNLVGDLMASLSRISSRNIDITGDRRHVTMQQFGLLVRFLFSCLIDADRVDTANFEQPRTARHRPAGEYAPWSVLVDRLERHLSQWQPTRPIDHLRREISDQCQQAATRASHGIYTLTVPTGGGKTLASLRFALHHAMQRKLDRIIYVIPFTSIIDQNAQVVRSVLESESAPEDHGRIVLEHHGSVTPERQTWREKILCENWDAPVVYTTMVQFLESLFGAGTRGARRMHQLANTVLIFDEVQTLPVSCVHIFNNAINFLADHCNATIVLCTATQPLLHQVAPERGAVRLAPQHELMHDTRKLFEDLARVDVKDQRRPEGWSHEDITQLAVGELNGKGSCLVIVNTKNSARRIFDLVQSSLPEDAVYHLSTDMCAAHRKQELAMVRSRLDERLPVLCISTQLIEAGVDVDFRCVVRFLAGLDSIAQAAGRCNRNGSAELGIVHIVNPLNESLEHLTDIRLGREVAQRVLDDYKKNPAHFPSGLVGPEALTDYYRHYFFERKDQMSYDVSAKDIGHNDSLLELLSSNSPAVQHHNDCKNEAPQTFFRQAFMTAAKSFKAIDAPTQGVIVPHGKAGKELINDLHAAYAVEKEIELLRKAQQFTVNVFPHVFKKLRDAQAIREVKPDTRIFCLEPQYYSKRFGLSTTPVSLMEPLYGE